MNLYATEVGAVGDGSTLCTKELQHAIDVCHESGGGQVVVPGGSFLTGTLQLRSRVGLFLEPGAVLLGSADIADYPLLPRPAYRSLHDVNGFRALVYAYDQEQVSVRGQGRIDGQGGSFAYGGHDKDGRPRGLLFVSCKDVAIEGLRLRNSAAWMQHFLNCDRVQIRGIEVWNHCNRNNDMLDIDGCREVTISDCISDTDDDGITLKSTGPAPCENVAISNCVLSSGCIAIKCGTESTGGFRNLAISNCIVKPTKSTKHFFGRAGGAGALALELVDGGDLDGVVVSNICVEGTLSPLFVRLGDRGRPYAADIPKPRVGRLRNVMIQNFSARSGGNIGCSVTGVPGHCVENVTLSNLRIELAQSGKPEDCGRALQEKEADFPQPAMWGRLPAYGLFARHVRALRMRDVVFVPFEGEPRPPFVGEDLPDLNIADCSFDAPRKGAEGVSK